MKLRLAHAGKTLLLILALLPVSVPAGAETASARSVPKLAVVILVDGLPEYQVIRYESLLGPGGIRKLLSEGAAFTNAHYDYAATYTVPGHATFMTGAYPSLHGLIANYWIDRTTGKTVYGLEDPAHRYLGEETDALDGTSPELMKAPTFGDALRIATKNASRVFSISGKDRGAIIGAGKTGTAYFLSGRSGRFITSDYYMRSYPGWVDHFFSSRPQDRWFGAVWDFLKPEETRKRFSEEELRPKKKTFPVRVTGGLSSPGPAYYLAFSRSPFATDHLIDFAMETVRRENLGRNPAGVPDLLFLSLSTHDYTNHGFGPESPQSLDSLLRIDAAVSRMLEFLENWTGEETLIVLTADHGFTPSPESCTARGIRAGRIDPGKMLKDLNGRLSGVFGGAAYASSWRAPTVYLDDDLIRSKGLDAAAVEEEGARFLRGYPGVAAVFTRSQFLSGDLPDPELAKKAARSWNPSRSGDLFIIQDYCWDLPDPYFHTASHGSPYNDDTQVPLIFEGPGIVPGRYAGNVRLIDAAPTISYLLGIPAPGASEGRVLAEALSPLPPSAERKPAAVRPEDSSAGKAAGHKRRFF